MSRLKQTLMKRDGISEKEAESQINAAKEDLETRLGEGNMPFDICEEWFGLEPDYIDDLISF